MTLVEANRTTRGSYFDRYRTTLGEDIIIYRNNSISNGYLPIYRELQGMAQLAQGIFNLSLGMLAPSKNEELMFRAETQMSDGYVNMVWSPITVIAIFALGKYE